MSLCRHLRWKSDARTSGDPLQVYASLARSQVPFSCLRTSRPWGPDEDVVGPDCCDCSRPCFVAASEVGRS